MNRSILIVICDFLLVSLLIFSTPDVNRVTGEGLPPPPQLQIEIAETNTPGAGEDLAAVMRLALEEEQKRRELLLSELNQARETAAAREQQARSIQQELARREQESRQLGQQFSALQQQYATAQTNIQRLQQQFEATASTAELSREKLEAMEAELKRRAEAAAALQNQLAELARSNQMVLEEKQRIASQLQVAEAEKSHALGQVTAMREQIQVEREEKARLAEGVKTLAAKSSELTQEIRENRPLASNTIFDEFMNNRVLASINAFRAGWFDSSRRHLTGTVLVTDGTNTFAIGHVEQTPFNLANPASQWDQLTGSLSRDSKEVPIRSLSFLFQDPRVFFTSVSTAEAERLGAKAYKLSADPFKFQDAVLIGSNGGYYGECRFEIDPSTSSYVRLDRSLLKGLFGKFNPSRGDLVFSRSGELLGIMVNDTYCLLLQKFDDMATFRFGADAGPQKTGDVLRALNATVSQLPPKLQ